MTNQPTTRRVLYTSFLVDFVDIVVNVGVATITGSTVMLVEAIAGMADLCSVFLLIIGNKRSQRRATRTHPFGYGKEQYFWSTLAGFVILVISANLSFLFSWHAINHPSPIDHLGLTYVALGLASCTNGYAFWQSAIKLLGGRPWTKLPSQFMQSWQTGPKTTLVLDAMGTTSALIGLVSLVLYGLTGKHHLDDYGALVMSVVLAIFAIILLIGVKSLIIGQSATLSMQRKIRQVALATPGVQAVPRIQTMIMGNESILANLEVTFHDNLKTQQIEQAIVAIEQAIQRALPDQTIQLTIEPVQG